MLCLGLNVNVAIFYIFQCPVCGRILLEGNKREFYSFLPEDSDNKRLLDYKGNEDIKFAKRHTD